MKKMFALIVVLMFALVTVPVFAGGHPPPPPPVVVSGSATQGNGGIAQQNFTYGSSYATGGQENLATYSASGSTASGSAVVSGGTLVIADTDKFFFGNMVVSSAFGTTYNSGSATATGTGHHSSADVDLSGAGTMSTGTFAVVGNPTTNGASGGTQTTGAFSYIDPKTESVIGSGSTTGTGLTVATKIFNSYLVVSTATSSSGATIH